MARLKAEAESADDKARTAEKYLPDEVNQSAREQRECTIESEIRHIHRGTQE